MAETNSELLEEPKAGKKKPPQSRKRRNYVAELTALERRVETSLALIERANRLTVPEAKAELLSLVEETLRGK